jgi:DNA invertase Pin-like site-specific DNA recombinase
MNIGYARVSTEDQHLDTQLQVLNLAGCKKLFQEKLSGRTRHRPELQRLLEQLRKGDTVIVTKLDRLARSTRDLLEITETIKLSGAGLKSLSEPWADTTSPAGKMILTVFAGIAEFERELILERTSIGRDAAKKRGVKFGRPSSLNQEQIALARRLFEEGKSAKEIARTFGVHKTTIYRNMNPSL